MADSSTSVHNLDTRPQRSQEEVVIVQEEQIVHHYGQRAYDGTDLRLALLCEMITYTKIIIVQGTYLNYIHLC